MFNSVIQVKLIHGIGLMNVFIVVEGNEDSEEDKIKRKKQKKKRKGQKGGKVRFEGKSTTCRVANFPVCPSTRQVIILT